MRRVETGVFEVRFVGISGASGVGSATGDAYATVQPAPGGVFRVTCIPRDATTAPTSRSRSWSCSYGSRGDTNVATSPANTRSTAATATNSHVTSL